MSTRFTAEAAPAAGAFAPRRRRAWREFGSRRLPAYLLLVPTAVVIGAVLAYPIYFLVRLSFERYDLFELIQHEGVWIGVTNYTQLFHDSEFWHVLARTLVFTGVNVALTMVLGTLVALLLAQLGGFMRLLLGTALVFVWATPVVVAVSVWQWMFDFQFGVVNWTLTKLHLGDFIRHDWFENPWSGFAVITALVVWGAIPFVAITLYAALTQVPRELVEAASMDGATSWRVFFDVTFPLLKPIIVILTSLSIIWDFQVFNQVWLMRSAAPEQDYYLMSIYSFTESFRQSKFGLGAAIAVVMVVTMFLVAFVYIRQMVKMGEVE
jgi:N,N'-diacetylchitobiose transport system permease protein